MHNNYVNILHCSDGMERTGTFIAIHSQVERLKTEGVVDFFQTIKSAGLQRTGYVHNTVSYKYTVCLHNYIAINTHWRKCG